MAAETMGTENDGEENESDGNECKRGGGEDTVTHSEEDGSGTGTITETESVRRQPGAKHICASHARPNYLLGVWRLERRGPRRVTPSRGLKRHSLPTTPQTQETVGRGQGAGKQPSSVESISARV